MIKFVVLPHFPNAVQHLLIGEFWGELLDFPLRQHGIYPLYIPENPNIDPRLRGHADLSVFHLGENRLILAPYLKDTSFEKKLSSLGCSICFADIQQESMYPQDAQLNICIWNNRWIGYPETAAHEILSAYKDRTGDKWYKTKQGYTKCSCCLVDDNAIISSDIGILRAIADCGAASLEIQPGHISLPGFSSGFIGGSSFKLSEKVLAFTGTLDSHPDKERILSFLAWRGIQPVFLTSNSLFDIGGAVPLTEKN